MLLSALLCSPFSLTSSFYEPEYWSPHRVWNLSTGMEDLFFSFTAGGVVWLFAVIFFRRRLILFPAPKPIWRRYWQCALYALAASLFFFWLGWGVMKSTLVVLYGWGFSLLAFQKKLWPVAFWGGASFLAIHILMLKFFFSLCPHFLGQWNLAAVSAIIWGMPLEELAWALGFGFTWPLYMAYVFNVQVPERSGNPNESPGLAGEESGM